MPLPELVNLSINQSITRSLNTSLATFTAITIAYVFASLAGIESIKDFALPMMVGTISGSYSTIFIAGPLWVMWKTRKGAHHAPVAPPPPAPAVTSGSSSKGAKAKA
jgi:preprotein translocase subunit SecF